MADDILMAEPKVGRSNKGENDDNSVISDVSVSAAAVEVMATDVAREPDTTEATLDTNPGDAVDEGTAEGAGGEDDVVDEVRREFFQFAVICWTG